MRPPEFWNHHDGRDSARVTRALLSPLAWLYSAAGSHRYASERPYRAAARVICIGNLTLGGVGKTPVVISVLTRLLARGLKVAALTRGYGGALAGPLFVTPEHTASDVGDEALLLSRAAPTIVSRNRAAGARLADKSGVDVLVMDDGFQNPSLAKDLSIVVVDGEVGFGNRCVFPAGPLREPIARGLARADAILTMRASPESVRNPVEGAGNWRGPLLNAWLEPDADAARTFWRERVVVFAGIGRPQKVVDTFTRIGAEVITAAPFPDHHVYTANDLAELRALAAYHQATLATTEKDFVRLPIDQQEGIKTLPVRAIFAVEPALDAVLAPVVAAIETQRKQTLASG
jgi:tetraacyldisaccharide 4'-kinase